jgi:hypothetical protein
MCIQRLLVHRDCPDTYITTFHSSTYPHHELSTDFSPTDPSTFVSSMLSSPAPPRISAIVALNEAHNMYGVNSQGGKFTLGDTDGREMEVVVEAGDCGWKLLGVLGG